jgi:hypothetical protein
MMFPVSEMKTSFSSFAVSFLCALPLHKKFTQWHIAGSEYTEVSVKGHYPFVLLQRQGCTNSNSFLPYATEPFGNFSLPQQQEHLILDHAGPEEFFIEIDQLIIG